MHISHHLCLQPLASTECSACGAWDVSPGMEADTGGASAPAKSVRHPTIDAPSSDEEEKFLRHRWEFSMRL